MNALSRPCSNGSKNFSLNCSSFSVLAYNSFQKTISIFLKYSIQNSSLFRVNSLNFITIHLWCLSLAKLIFHKLFSQLLVRSKGSFKFAVSFQKAEWNTSTKRLSKLKNKRLFKIRNLSINSLKPLFGSSGDLVFT